MTEYSVFAEARFGTRAGGGWAAVGATGGPLAWEKYARDGNRVRAVVRADHRPGTGTVELPDHVAVEPMPYYVGARGLVSTLPSLAAAVWRAVSAADTIVVRVPGVLGSLAALACRSQGRRYAVEVVGDPADVLRAGVLGATGRLLARPAGAWMRALVRGGSASMFVTSTTLQRRYPPRSGTPTVGVTNARLAPDAFVSHGRSWTPAPFRLVTVGSQENRYKGHDVLLNAMRLLLDDGLNVVATVVGGGREHERIVSLGRSLGLADRVRFTAAVHDRSRIAEILDSAAVFVLPSRTEGLPRALVEAMARALPAVGSDVGGIPELLDRSCRVPVGDPVALARAVRRLLVNPGVWVAESSRNLDMARAYTAADADRRFAAWLARVPSARRARVAWSIT
jgi:glycosyltransferase involved in cell wall biosynthesis